MKKQTHVYFSCKNVFDKGFRDIFIKAIVTYVVVIATAVSNSLNCELWFAYGHGDKVRFIPCHLLCSRMGPLTAEGLLFFHAFTGCNATSTFYGIGKKLLGTSTLLCQTCQSCLEIWLGIQRFCQKLSLSKLKDLQSFFTRRHQSFQVSMKLGSRCFHTIER